MTTDNSRKPHYGRNVKRIRTIRGVSQEQLAERMGEEWNQKRISLLEGRGEINDELLERVAKALNLSADDVKAFDEDKAIYNTQNNYEGASVTSSPNGQTNNDCVFNPLDEMIAAFKKNEQLYEDLIKEKDARIADLKRLLGKVD